MQFLVGADVWAVIASWNTMRDPSKTGDFGVEAYQIAIAR